MYHSFLKKELSAIEYTRYRSRTDISWEQGEPAMQNGRFQSESTASNTQPETASDSADLVLEDILDLEDLQSLLTDFHRLTNIPIALIDLDGHVLIQRGWQEICARFHRVNPVSRKNCIESGLKLFTGAEPGQCLL
jgi:hypothetical protein